MATITGPIAIDNPTTEQEQMIRSMYSSWEAEPTAFKLVEMREYLQANGFIVGSFVGCCNGWQNQITAWVGYYINIWDAAR